MVFTRLGRPLAYNRFWATLSVRIYRLVVEPGRAEHIARHHVALAEVEDVAFGAHVTFRSRRLRYALLGRTAGGRYLKLIVAPRGRGVYGLVTAMDASDAERRLYRRHMGS